MSETPNPLLQYLLERIEKSQTEGFSRLENQLSQKADKADVQRVEDRLDHAYAVLDTHQQDLDGLKAKDHDEDIEIQIIKSRKGILRKRAVTFWNKLWYVILSVALIVATLLSGYLGAHSL